MEQLVGLLEVESDYLKVLSKPTEDSLTHIGYAMISESDKQVLLGSQSAMVQIAKYLAALANDNKHVADHLISENVVNFVS